MSTRTVPFFLFFLLFQPSLSVAQTADDPHRYDQKIDRFLEQNRRDSFLFYIAEKSRLSRQADDLALWTWTQLDLHDWYSEHNDNEAALRILDVIWQQRWREPKSPEEWEPLLYVQQNRGWCLFEAGKVWQAVQAYESAAQLYERFRYPDFEAVETIYKPLGAHYTRLGDNDKAIVVFEKALALGGDNETLAGLYSNIGIAYWNQGEGAEAANAFRKGLDLKRVSTPKAVLLQSGLAQVLLDGGQAREAFEIAGYALDNLAATGSPDRLAIEYRAYARRIAGLAATDLGQFREAEQLLNGALADARAIFGGSSRDAGKVEIALSVLFRKQNKPEAAIAAANRALQAVLPGYSPDAADKNPAPGSFYEENVIFEALEAKALAAEMWYTKQGNIRWLTLALECHDLAWQAEMLLRKVHQYNSSKLDLQQTARRREASAMRVVRLLFEKTGHSRYIDKALAIAERSKATLLLEALQENQMRGAVAGKDERFARMDALRRSLAYYERNLLLEPASPKASQWRIEADALGSQLSELERALARDYPRLSGSVLDVARVPVPALSTGETLLTYFAGENTIEVLVFQKDKPATWHSISNDEAFNALLNRFFAFYASSAAMLNEPAAYLQTAFDLWQKIIPAEAAGAQRLLVIPDGLLNFVPFEALVTEAPAAGASLRNAAYLVTNQEVRYAWSLAVLEQQNRLPSRAEQFMLAIAPGFSHSERGLAPLLADAREWRSAGSGVTVLAGERADVRHLLDEAARYRVLHFSTHAFADATPRIELIDQSLLLPDLYALPLNADLVVLSACQTGLGIELKGEGVMSLARAFAQAGTAGVVSSLWSVNDRSTASILNLFYQYIREGWPVSASLRQAKLAYISDPKTNAALQSPYFWAGQVLVGADRKLETGSISAAALAGWIALGVGVLILICYLYVYRRKAGSHHNKFS